MTDSPEPQHTARQIAALETLLTHLIDARGAMDAQLQQAEGDLARLIRKFREEHHQHAERIAKLLFALGVDADPQPSFRGRAASALAALRALFEAPNVEDRTSLAEAGSALVEEFDAAIRATPANHHRDDLEEMREETARLVAEARGK